MKHAMHCIAFVSPLGGTGQTTVVANLASLWSAAGRACLALDLCAQNSLGLHLGLAQPAPLGWSQAVAAGTWWGEPALENSAQVWFLPYGNPAGQAPPSGPQQSMNQALLTTLEQSLAQDPHWLSTQLQSLALEAHSLVLLDVPPWPQPLAAQALRCADLVVVCLDTSARATQMRDHVAALLAQARPATPLAVLATRFNPRRDSQCQALEALQALWPQQLSPYVLHDDESVAAALAAQHCVTAYAPQAQSAHDLHGIAHWLLDQCPATQDGAA